MRLALRSRNAAVGKSRPLAWPVTQTELLKSELIYILKQTLLCISALLLCISHMFMKCIPEVLNVPFYVIRNQAISLWTV